MTCKILFFLLLFVLPVFAADWDINKRYNVPAGPVGQCLENGLDLEKMLTRYEANSEEFNYLRRRASSGDNISMCILGLTYIEGKKTAQNVEIGMEWLTKSADSGYAPASVHLYRIYREGVLVPQDKTQAIYHLEQIDHLPHAEDACLMARELVLGEIVDRDLAMASNLYLHASGNCPVEEEQEFRELTKDKAIVAIIFKMVLPTLLVAIFMLALWIFFIKQTGKLKK